jgi:hypothetical protein
MIFSGLQQSIVDRLLWDAYFTEPGKEVKCLAQKLLDLRAQWDAALAKLGAAVIIGTIGCAPTDRVDLADVDILLQITENVTLNRGKNGSQKPACDVGAKCMALLRQWTPNNDMWAPFLLWGQGFQYVGEDEEGLDHWTLQFRTQTVLDLLVTALGTDTGAAIGDENQTPLIVSPTPA